MHMHVVYIHVMVVEVGVVIAAILLHAGGVSSAAELLHERYKRPETGSVQVSNANSSPFFPSSIPPLLTTLVYCIMQWVVPTVGNS